MERKTPKSGPVGLYLPAEETRPDVFTSGCPLLDCVLGGGWAEGRIANIVGDKSTGKTLLAIEACANFTRKHKDGRVHYIECEAAFDEAYARRIGLPQERLKLIEKYDTVEDLFEYLDRLLSKPRPPTLCIVDSLDSLSDRAELERNIDAGSYGADKPKKLSTLFRRLIRKIRRANMTIIIISQVRDRLGVTFGKTQTRTGGKALDFYASQVVWLANHGRIYSTRSGVKRPIGVKVGVKAEKNKIAAPYRECEFPIRFDYGIDDVTAALDFMTSVKRLDAVGLKRGQVPKFLKSIVRMDAAEFKEQRAVINEAVVDVWKEIEERFKPPRRKYE